MVPNLTFVYDRKGQATRTKAAPVELRITTNGVRKYITTGVKLLPKEWSKGSVVNRMDWKELNDQLQMFKKKCAEIIAEMIEDGNLDIQSVPTILRDKMIVKKTFLEYCEYQTEKKLKVVSPGTRRHYATLLAFLKEWNGITLFSQVTEANIMKMDRVLEKRGLKVDSRWNYHKRVKMFISKAVNDGLLKRNPYNSLDISRGDCDGLSRYLTPAEFQRLESCEMTKKSYEKARDIFVFQTYTMMAYADMAAFRIENCIKIDGKCVYKARRQKTKQEFTIALLKPVLDILDKYNGKLPVTNNAYLNEQLKGAAKEAGIDKPVSSHWARHTGATLLLNKGVSIHIIQHILGHSSIRETERTYAKLLDSTIVDAMEVCNSME